MRGRRVEVGGELGDLVAQPIQIRGWFEPGGNVVERHHESSLCWGDFTPQFRRRRPRRQKRDRDPIAIFSGRAADAQ